MTTIYSVMYPTQQPTGTTGASTTGASGTNATFRSPGSPSLGAAAAPSAQDTKSWYEAMAQAWGQALNNQAQVTGVFTPPFNTTRIAEDLTRAAPYLGKS